MSTNQNHDNCQEPPDHLQRRVEARARLDAGAAGEASETRGYKDPRKKLQIRLLYVCT